MRVGSRSPVVRRRVAGDRFRVVRSTHVRDLERSANSPKAVGSVHAPSQGPSAFLLLAICLRPPSLDRGGGREGGRVPRVCAPTVCGLCNSDPVSRRAVRVPSSLSRGEAGRGIASRECASDGVRIVQFRSAAAPGRSRSFLPVERGGRAGRSRPESARPDGVRIVQSRSGVAPGRSRSFLPVERGGREGGSHPESARPTVCGLCNPDPASRRAVRVPSSLSRGEAGRGIASREYAARRCADCAIPIRRRAGPFAFLPPCRKGRPGGESRPESARPDGVRIVQFRSGVAPGLRVPSSLSRGEAGRG